MKFKILDDLAMADSAFEAYGKNYGELLENAALALFEVMVNTSKVEAVDEFEIEIKGKDEAGLVFDYLSELVFLKDKEGVVLGKFEVEVNEEAGEKKVKVRVWGEEVDFKKHEFKVDVKAVTMHKLVVEKNKDGYVARVVVDV